MTRAILTRSGSRRIATATFGLALTVGIAAAATSCYVVPEAPIWGHERDDLACSDGIDNDYDYLIDCWDPDCLSDSTLCGQIVPEVPIDEPEPRGKGVQAIESCRDRIDNDQDGQFDCGDRECRDIPETCCIIENTNELCSDGIDNDGNGFADCEDFGCSGSDVVSICDEGAPEDDVLRCTDGLDNNGNGKIDCEDWGCSEVWDCPFVQPPPPENTLEQCRDHEDNDDDGFTDCQDFSCSRPEPDNPEADDLEILCGDGDGNGDEPEDTKAACSDGEDNDGDGRTDCDDFDCDAFCEPEDTFEACTDGVDNDGNGFTDCADFSCSQAPLAVRRACSETAIDERSDQGDRPLDRAFLEDAIRQLCSDGQDQDADGFVDCDDWDCSHNIYLPDFCDGDKVCRYRDPF